MNIPNFFIVWEPKCWTTIIHDYLNQHPDVFLSYPKEPHYFSTDLQDESDRFHGKVYDISSIRNESEYLKLFEKSWNSKIIWEWSTNYVYSKTAAYNIYKFNPDSKILFGIREPLDFLQSWHWQLTKKLIENKTDFLSAIESEHQRRKRKEIPSTCVNPSLLFYSEFIKFEEHLKRFLKFFPKEHIKVFLYEDFKKNNQEIMNEIFDFLGIKHIELQYKKSNPRSYMKYPTFYRIFYNNKIKFLAKKTIPWSIRQKAGEIIFNLATSPQKAPKLWEKDILKLKKKYKSQVKKINDLLHTNWLIKRDIDLIKYWWYEGI